MPDLRQMRLCLRSREGPGRYGPVIVGQTRYRRAGTGKTDGINGTYAPVIDACFVIAGQKWRSSPLMTLDHAGRPVRCGVSRANGGNVRLVACAGWGLPAFDPRSCPGRPRFSWLWPSAPEPGRQASRRVADIRCPRSGGLVQSALSKPGHPSGDQWAREKQPPGRAPRAPPTCTAVLRFAPAGGTRRLRLTGRLAASGTKSATRARCLVSIRKSCGRVAGAYYSSW
jgi:hypothetical protein